MMVELRKAKAMQAIFVIIKCALGLVYAVAEKLADQVDEISEVHSISGQYDLLAKFSLPKDADIGHPSLIVENLFSAVVIMAVVTTIVSPMILNCVFGRGRR